MLAVVMAATVLSDPSDPLEKSYCTHLPICCDVATPENGYKNTTSLLTGG
jgi:hypothetical protein